MRVSLIGYISQVLMEKKNDKINQLKIAEQEKLLIPRFLFYKFTTNPNLSPMIIDLELGLYLLDAEGGIRTLATVIPYYSLSRRSLQIE